MAVGIYGTVRPSDVSINDIEMFYNYVPNRETTNTEMFRLDTAEFLNETYLPTDEQVVGEENILEGLYNMKLPANIFNQTGIYTIYIKPTTTFTTIIDCSVLSSLPTVSGIVLDMNSLPEEMQANNALQGYRVEYLNDDGTKLRNVVRYVVTSNKVVPVSQNVGNTSQRAIRYRFDDVGTLLFLQLTPSSSSDVKPNVIPFKGVPGQTILLSNTFFNPLAIEVELVRNTLDTIADLVGGEQIKDVDNGILTYYDSERKITRQFDLYELKDEVGDVPLYEVKERRISIDESQNFNEITDEVQ